MFGLVIKGLAGIGVGLCFSVARAVYDVVSQRRSIRSAILNVGLSSVFHGLADTVLDSTLFNVDLPLSDDSHIQVSIQDLAECTAQSVVDAGTRAWLSSHKIETLPSGLAVARAAVVDVSGNAPSFQGIITQSTSQIIKRRQQIHLPVHQIVLSHTILQSNQLPHRTLTGKQIN